MRDREHTIYDLARLGCSRWQVEAVLRDLPKIQRMNEAECNGSGDANDPYFAFVLRGAHALRRVCDILDALPAVFQTRLQSDPRGACVHVWTHDRSKDEEPTYRLGAPGFTTAELLRLDRRAAMVAK